ncbi:hypothetical protein VKT23_002826 [Stygiomarasmius scandens]|uniref:Uncharacterized protein n=1 Tax=Marasmiellus scandens TaxID=2682957 RepID=A0ABR1JVA5_9AGAR
MSQQASSTEPPAASQPPSIFTMLTRTTYVPPSPSAPPTPTRKSSKDARAGASVDPSVLDALIIKQPLDTGGEPAVQSASSNAPISSWLNLTTIAQDPVFMTPAGAFDGIDSIVKA